MHTYRAIVLLFLIAWVNLLMAQVELVVLGTAQDAGSPQIGCQKKCCIDLWNNPDHTRKVSSLGVVDYDAQKSFLFDATPDIKSQIDLLQKTGELAASLPEAILLTHAHMGHYSGLIHLGKEAINAKGVEVAVMPRMKEFLSTNGPWDQLVNTNNISLYGLQHDSTYYLSPSVEVVPFIVPHRDEYSETVGYRIIGPNKSALFIPDIDKWHLWDRDIRAEIQKVDYAFLDATFYDGEELGGRDMSTIPHPSVEESMALFDSLSDSDRAKVHFIHFNHTNPLLNPSSEQYSVVISKGYRIAQYGQKFDL